MTTPPLIELRDISRSFAAGDQTLTVLDQINLTIEAGEMVAIIGASGSGKSTLMNIIGCLDRPSGGSYLYAGRDVATMPEEQRARLRRRHFGFIFQRYQLLADLDALENVEVPAVYAGHGNTRRHSRARMLLERLGLGDRMGHRPRALSGGQQQRVSVARALMNGGEVILADEPTGALDSRSGADLLALLRELNAQGHTIVIVTHDRDVAASADRVIEIRDGRIIGDHRNRTTGPAPQLQPEAPGATGPMAGIGRLKEALRMAVRALNAHRLRSFLTMLGIIIGIASVVSVVALGNGSKERVLENIASLGTNTITIRPGTGFGDRMARSIDTLVTSDADALGAEPFTASVSPEIGTTTNVTYRGVTASISVRGVGPDYFNVGGFSVQEGDVFGADAVAARRQVAVLDTDALATLFPDGSPAIGQVIRIGRVPVQVIGIISQPAGGPGMQQPRVFLPFSTVAIRLTGQSRVDSVSVRVRDDFDMTSAEAGIEALLMERHGRKDFFLMNSDTIRSSITSTTQTLTLLISSIAVISLIVGGIGVMNIMLVSVTERTKEIGVRMAVGARPSDIVAQFLIEAVLVCLLGGLIGVGLALGTGALIGELQGNIRLNYSATTVILAFLSSTVIGVVFGFLPARAAARLDPVEALSRE